MGTATTVRPVPPSESAAPPTAVRLAVRRVALAPLLLPLGVATVALAVVGRADRAAARWRRPAPTRLGRPAGPARPSAPPGAARVVAFGLVSAVAGVIGLVEVGLLALSVARGFGYGLVVDGPYTEAWGGPSRAGAWSVHAAVGLGVAVVAVALGIVVTALHTRLTAGLLDRERVPARVVLPALGSTAVTAVFVVAWVRQL